MIKNFRFLFILLIVSVPVKAQDSIAVAKKLLLNSSPAIIFATPAAYNPGAVAYTLRTELSDLNIRCEKQTGEAGLAQTGSSFEGMAVNARSYMKTGEHHIWGKASYEQKHTDNINWNESSDFFNVYPYVLADSVGGDNLVGEKYSFMGGYARNMKRIAWGIQLDYWALMEYREIDPRPDNNTSNLVFTAGLNYKLTNTYAFGGGLMLRKYKQKNTLTFYNVLGHPSTHQMTGMGTDAYLFANGLTDCLFNGNGYGVNLQFMPVKGMGWSGTFSYENFSFDKQLNNAQKLVLSDIDEDQFLLDISWLKQAAIHIFGTKLKASYTNRQGTEGKFTRNDNGTLVCISTEQQYRNEVSVATLTLIYQQKYERSLWYVLPYASYLNIKESHKSSQRSMNISRIDLGIKPGLSRFVGKHMIQLEARLACSTNIERTLELNGMSPGRNLIQTLNANYDYLSSDCKEAGLSARFDYILRNSTALYLKASWDCKKYNAVTSDFLSLQLGVVF